MLRGMWKWLAGAGALVVATGLLPADQAGDVVRRVLPILVFLAAITVVAELVDAAGVFGATADRAARLARGSVPVLFVLVAVLATVTTAVLSLDTTAVLITPLVLTLAARLELPAAPFAVLTLWVANTGSLVLPVSNLTNLLAADRLDRLDVSFVPLMAAPAVAVLGLTLVLVGSRYRARLTGRYTVPAAVPVADRALFAVAAGTCLAAAPLFALGVAPELVATGAALVLLAAFAVRARGHLRPGLLPWRLVLTTLGAFLVVQAVLRLGGAELLAGAAGTGTGTWELLRLAGTAATASNLVNNLPAYLALEPDAQTSAVRLGALLVGTDAGPLLLPWGSLATLLWLDRCRARGVRVPVRELTALALVGVPLLVVAGTLALAA